MRINTFITRFLQVILLLLIPIFAVSEHHVRALAALAAFVVSFIPAIVRRNYKITMPWIFDFFIVVMLLVHLAGLQLGFYNTFWWWDNMAHLMGSAIVAALGFMVVYALQQSGTIHISIRMIAMFSFFFAIAIGAVWEIGEFTSDTLLHTHNQFGNTDTMVDLINDSAAGLIVAVVGALVLRNCPAPQTPLHHPHKLKDQSLFSSKESTV
jgi:FlaA1/EpsC-like NDP-sugar epimerase